MSNISHTLYPNDTFTFNNYDTFNNYSKVIMFIIITFCSLFLLFIIYLKLIKLYSESKDILKVKTYLGNLTNTINDINKNLESNIEKQMTEFRINLQNIQTIQNTEKNNLRIQKQFIIKLEKEMKEISMKLQTIQTIQNTGKRINHIQQKEFTIIQDNLIKQKEFTNKLDNLFIVQSL